MLIAIYKGIEIHRTWLYQNTYNYSAFVNGKDISTQSLELCKKEIAYELGYKDRILKRKEYTAEDRFGFRFVLYLYVNKDGKFSGKALIQAYNNGKPFGHVRIRLKEYCIAYYESKGIFDDKNWDKICEDYNIDYNDLEEYIAGGCLQYVCSYGTLYNIYNNKRNA